ncbi:uncharacterized protein LOC117588363 [Drosophila guanche]|uniref:Uncharacterized protein n=1 Tax=Drosophila guanche TaxID=7266 RepID=A0A3B0K1I9_DROGU|nr:uncharacterized protein LOC117588363 [Drosophila guanche]SPP86532.1 Hypothetical predicted protein [Drosophila guanche]
MLSAQRIYPLCCLLGLLLLVPSPAEARHTRRPRRTTTPRTPRPTLLPDRHWPPSVLPAATTEAMPRLVDSFDQRSADGQYEFRYQLDDGNTRYERAYWLPVGKDLVLARKGYYSFPLPNQQFSTVFYRADHLGYHVDMNTLSGKQPLLPRNLEVPLEQEQELELEPAAGVRADAGKDEVQGPNALNQVETETETETEPSTVANDILATEAAVSSHADDELVGGVSQ